MVFSGIPFLYYFLPAALMVYFLSPRRAKNGVLLLFSLVFYGWSEPGLVWLMALTIVCFFLLGLAVGKTGRRCFLIAGIVLGVGLLAVFKYGDFLLGSVNALTGLNLPLLNLALPVGISFYTFQALSYLIDVYLGRVPPQKNLVSFGTYIAMFPQLIAGPIVRYEAVAGALENRVHTWEDAAWGLRRFLVGLGKKVILADNFARLISVFRSCGEKSVLFYWLYAAAFSLELYYDFSGYSDMAIGLGRTLGFPFPENFDYPYLAESVTAFWRRWHMTLGAWFRDYVYIPLGGSRVSRGRWVGNILAVWLLTGLWHGAAWNFVLWGLVFAGLLLAEKTLALPLRLPGPLRHGYVLLAVGLSFVLFNAESLGQAGADYAAMFGLAGLPLTSRATGYYLRGNALLFLAGILGATPLPRSWGERAARTKAGPVLTLLFCLGLLLTATAYLVDGSFSPFLYFRF